jgi:hypothetical protein
VPCLLQTPVLRWKDLSPTCYATAIQHLEVELRASPVTSLGIVSDLVASPHAYPLWDGTVLLLLLSKLLLNLEGLVSVQF